MSPRAQVYFLGLLLVFLGFGLMIYKSSALTMPLLPGQYATVWTVEAKVGFEAKGEPVKVSLSLPDNQNNFTLIEEIFSSSGYGFNVHAEDGSRRAEWSKRDAKGTQTLFYKLDVYKSEGNELLPSLGVPEPASSPGWKGSAYDSALNSAQSLINKSQQASADQRSFVVQLLTQLTDPANSDSRLIQHHLRDRSLVELTVDLMSLAGISSHIIRGIYLEDDRNRLKAQSLLELYVDGQWRVYSLDSAEEGLPENFMVWQRGEASLLEVEGGDNSRVVFSVLANDVPARKVALSQMSQGQSTLLDYSIYSLPIEQQSVFKFILLVPVGALIVIFLRVIVGIRTAGTFMPVLLGIAFIQTNLLNGIVIFLLILGVGLFVRSYLSRLDLLLVARLAAVVVIVVFMMSILSIVSYKLGIEQALSVTFFPMIIIAWTIEHMSILWEDDGPYEVFIQTLGSLVVAVICYLAMTNGYIEHWMFNFPELLLVLLGIIIIIGHYTGYRLSELMRFRHLKAS